MSTEIVTPVVTPMADPRSRSHHSWRGRLAVMASRGEVDGPRVREAQRALAWHRLNAAISAEVESGYLPPELGEVLINQLPAGGGAP